MHIPIYNLTYMYTDIILSMADTFSNEQDRSESNISNSKARSFNFVVNISVHTEEIIYIVHFNILSVNNFIKFVC